MYFGLRWSLGLVLVEYYWNGDAHKYAKVPKERTGSLLERGYTDNIHFLDGLTNNVSWMEVIESSLL